MFELFILNVEQLSDEKLFDKYYHKMSDKRKEKIDKLKILNDKMRSLGAGIVIDEYLQTKGSCEKDISILNGENGKPYFARDEKARKIFTNNIYFNISHSGNYVIGVFSDCEAGCDIETTDEKKLNIANRFFTEKEQSYTFDGNSNFKETQVTDVFEMLDKNYRFVRIWTLKESYLKYLGTGLTKSPESFSIENLDEENIFKYDLLNNKLKKYDLNKWDKITKSGAFVTENERECEFYECIVDGAYISVCLPKVKNEGVIKTIVVK